MKTQKLLFALVAYLTSFALWAQDITGDWYGVLKVQGVQLRIVFHVNKADNGYTATMDSPDQHVNSIPATATVYESPTLKVSIANAGIDYEGILGTDENITGTFKQNGQSFPVNLSRTAIEKTETPRPQNPAKPYPYIEEEVIFENLQAGIRLAGTLTLPREEGHFPAVVLISGSGAQNRDEELMGHKPFLVLADYLTRNGIAVLRYDDRGTADSEGNFQTATTFDLSTDVESAVTYLLTRAEIDRTQIGLVGHSEGGSIAPMVAARTKDVAFIILLAGTGIQGNELLLLQSEALSRASGASEEEVQALTAFYRSAFDLVLQPTQTDDIPQTILAERIKELIVKYPTVASEESDNEAFAGSLAEQLASPWMKYFLAYNPAVYLERVACPVLVLNGEKDLQVPSKVNLEAIRSALRKGGNKTFTIKEFSELNHLFQECKTGHPSEYPMIEQTIFPNVLTEILSWITAQRSATTTTTGNL